MNTDIRVKLSFFGNRKTRKLIAKLGLEGPWGLLRLWAYAAQDRPNGYLTGMSNEDIAMEAHVSIDPDTFVQALREGPWLDDDMYLHDWHEHQPHLKTFTKKRRLCTKTWKKIKLFIFARDGFVCSYCGASNTALECDHVVPLARGGDNALSNLTTACAPCNRSKGAMMLEDWKK